MSTMLGQVIIAKRFGSERDSRDQPSASIHAIDKPRLILTYIHSFDPGGVERVALRMNAAWRKMGVDARVIVGRASCPADGIADDVDYRIIPDSERVRRYQQIFWALRRLPQIIRQEQPDIIFCPGNTYTSVAVGMKLILGSHCPPIVAKISNDLVREDMNPLVRFFYRRWLWIQGRFIERFVAMAPAMVAEIADRIVVPDDRIAVINDPVMRTDEFDRYSNLVHIRALRGRRFIAIGRLMPQKNFALLLDAFVRIAHRDDRLTILGEGPERAMLEQRIAELGIVDQVTLPGHVNDVLPWFAEADVFVMSSDYEGVPAVLIEALAARLSVVATNCSASMADLIGHGRFGTLVPIGDEAALAAAMDTAAHDKACPHAVLEHIGGFTVEAGAQAYLDLMDDVIAAQAEARIAG